MSSSGQLFSPRIVSSRLVEQGRYRRFEFRNVLSQYFANDPEIDAIIIMDDDVAQSDGFPDGQGCEGIRGGNARKLLADRCQAHQGRILSFGVRERGIRASMTFDDRSEVGDYGEDRLESSTISSIRH